MANSSFSLTNASCGLPTAFWTTYSVTYTITYYVLAPVYLIFGLTGHLIALIAFSKESKQVSAYAYQVLISINNVCKVVFYILYVVTLKWSSGASRDSVAWFRDQYFLVWYAARMATAPYNMCVTISLFLSLSVSLERFWALRKPTVYKAWNHDRTRLIALIVSVSIGVSTSVFAIFRYQIEVSDKPEEGYYIVVLNLANAFALTPSLFAHLRNVVRMTALVMLIISNTMNLKLFRNRVLKIGQNHASNNPNNPSVMKKMAAERTLFNLVLVESTLTATNVTSMSAYFLIIFTNPEITKCEGLLMLTLVDVVLNVTNMGKFYIFLLVDKRFRRKIFRLLRQTDAV